MYAPVWLNVFASGRRVVGAIGFVFSGRRARLVAVVFRVERIAGEPGSHLQVIHAGGGCGRVVCRLGIGHRQ